MAIQRCKILVVGDIMLDVYCGGCVNRISPEAPVPVLNSKDNNIRKVAGGAANVAVNLKAAGAEAYLFSVIGKDSSGFDLRELLCAEGIFTKWIYTEEQRPTTTKLRYIGQNNQQILRVDQEVTAPVKNEIADEFLDEIEQSITDFSAILLSDYLKGFLTEYVCKRLVSMARENGIPVIIDVKDKNYEKYKYATLLKPNCSELFRLTEMPVDNVEQIKAASLFLLKETKSEYILTTLGAEGMLLVGLDGTIKQIQSKAREVFDVTGAGDTSIAYLTIELAKGKSIEDAMEIANYAAGVQVSKVGTSVVLPSEVAAAMRKDSLDRCIFDRKICSLQQIESIIASRKSIGQQIVFTNGCFDILHAGHVKYLHEARKLGDCLVVGVNSDASVRRLKGATRPINCLEDREFVLSALEEVDYIVDFDEDTPIEVIKTILPDVLVKGGDYTRDTIVGADLVESNGGNVITIPLVEGKSTTNIIKKING